MKPNQRTKWTIPLLIIITVLSLSMIGGLNRTTTSLNFDTLNSTATTQRRPIVVLRIDDIQDFAFKEGQKFLLEYHAAHRIPVDLAVIPAFIGYDDQLVSLLRASVRAGAEISAHGWQHENLTLLGLNAQVQLMTKSSLTLQRLLNVDVTVLVPPMYYYNNETLDAMKATGYTVISSNIDLQKPGTLSNGILSIPSTVELSTLDNNTWTVKEPDELMKEVNASIQSYGFAVVVLHPQEFLNSDGSLNPEAVLKYENFVASLTQNYTLMNFEEMQKTIYG